MGSFDRVVPRMILLRSQGITSGCSDPIVGNVTTVQLGTRRVGEDDPLYKDKIKQGLSATNNLSVEKYTMRYKRGYLSAIGVHPAVKGCKGFSEHCGLNPYVPGYSVSAALVQKAETLANIGIRKRIRAEQAAFSGPTMLGELRETIRMLKSPAQTLRKRTGQFIDHHKPRRNRPGYGRTLADSWLEYAFGAAPFLNDIANIADAALQLQEQRIKRVSYTSIQQEATSDVFKNGVNGLAFAVSFSRDKIHTAKVKYLAGLALESNLSSGNLGRIKQLSGFDLSEVIPTAWEFLPWSFLIDYFSNIGDVLAATTTSLAEVAWWSRTEVTTTGHWIHSGTLENVDPTWAQKESFTAPTMSCTAIRINRTKSGPGIPTLRLELPGTPIKFLNMGALLAAAALK